MRTHAWGYTGWKVPVVGQGTWQLEADDRGKAIAALRRGVELGLTHVDTAELYGDGEVEALVGEAISGRRDEVFLVSKVHPKNGSYRNAIAACEKSLKRLGTDRLDSYLLHWPGAAPLEETIRAFETLREEGKIRSWGVSNFDVEELEEAERIAPGRIACNQVLYHLQERTIEARVLPWCEARGIAVVGYSPFGSGSFPSLRSKGGAALAELAQVHGATPRQVALAFLTRRPSLFAIPKSASAAHTEDNAKAGSLRLSAEEQRAIDAAFPLRDSGGLPVI